MARLQQDVLSRQAQQAFAAGDMRKAWSICQQLLRHDKRNAEALIMQGQIALAQNQFDLAAEQVLKAVTQRPQDPRPPLLLAVIRIHQGRYDEAVARCDKVLRRHPGHPRAIGVKAEAFEKSGQRDKARAVLRPLIEGGRETPEQAMVQARLELHDGDDEAVIELTTNHIRQAEAGGQQLPNLYFLLGRALEHAQRFDEAFDAYERGNKAQTADFDADTWRQQADPLIEAFTPQRFSGVPRASHGSELPVFVLGMPRSGSTLVEAILDAHPDVAGAGEFPAMEEIARSISGDIGSSLPYPACMEDLDQDDVNTIAGAYLDRLRGTDDAADRIVDKYLNNYLHLGLLAILFPQARIIHCRRHPLDTCLSCFQTPLWPTVHPYATDLEHLGVAYVTYEQLMRHWRDVLEIPLLEIRYEALVADQQGMTRRLLEFCGLDFDERCLRYYEVGGAVQTASYDQVNRPIYSSSVGRYRNFEKRLGPLKGALAEGGWTEAALERAATAG
ncbi:MAG: tetratricopeptide repeat-containing sulfotransferase family protein [Planctomycetota bacterium]|jgi:tetratricopeptide (TPR) repeat protein